MTRRLITLFATLLLLCAGLSGAARAAVATAVLAEQAFPEIVSVGSPAETVRTVIEAPGSPAPLPDPDADPAFPSLALDGEPGLELADVPPPLPPCAPPTPGCSGALRVAPPCALTAPASPYLEGLLRPPSLRG